MWEEEWNTVVLDRLNLRSTPSSHEGQEVSGSVGLDCRERLRGALGSAPLREVLKGLWV